MVWFQGNRSSSYYDCNNSRPSFCAVFFFKLTLLCLQPVSFSLTVELQKKQGIMSYLFEGDTSDKAFYWVRLSIGLACVCVCVCCTCVFKDGCAHLQAEQFLGVHFNHTVVVVL